jgi:molybdopterin molybdotransferase
MVQRLKDCFEGRQPLLSVADALARMAPAANCRLSAQRVPLRHAVNRILAEDVVAPRPMPPTDNAAVDGYGLAFASLMPDAATRLTLVGRAAAGHPYLGEPPVGGAVRIFTGAPLPKGCDTVVMQEDCVVEAGNVIVPTGIRRGANVRRAGEDLAAGALLLRRGTRLKPQEVAFAAAAGFATLPLYAPLRVAIFSTGDEIREPGTPAAAAEIYDANRYLLIGLLERLGCCVSDLGILADRPDALAEALLAAAEDHDAILSTGGMSVGEEDHVKAAVARHGALDIWQLAIKPGRPFGFGHVRGTPFIGLPGNPVAVMVTFLKLARPLLLRLAGSCEPPPEPLTVAAGFQLSKKSGRREFLRVRIKPDEQGVMVAEAFARQGSGILSSLVFSDGLVELAEDLTEVKRGMPLPYLPFAAFS